MTAGAPKIVIGIPTRGRRAPLLRLLRSIAASCAAASSAPTILIMQNDVTFSLAEDPDIPRALGALPFVLKHEPKAGLCIVRNRLFAEAEALNAEWFIGVDDDEWVSAEWFSAFHAQISQATPDQIFFAPCRLVYDGTLSRFRDQAQVPAHKTGDRPPFFASHNFAIHRHFFAQAHKGARFDPAFNVTGGEDLEFFERLERFEASRMIWVAQAIVYEERIAERATLLYRMRRFRRLECITLRIADKHMLPQPTMLGSAKLALLGKALRFGFAGMVGAIAAPMLAPLLGGRAFVICGDRLCTVWSGLGIVDYLTRRQLTHYPNGTPDNTVVHYTEKQ